MSAQAHSAAWWLCMGVLLTACRSREPAAPELSPKAVSEAAQASRSDAQVALGSSPDRAAVDASFPRVFGAKPALTTAPVQVERVLDQPDEYLGKVIRCEGTVARVCQRAGCWLELQGEGGGLRVPMAGHAFFVPQTIVGHRAVIEGGLSAQALRPEHRAHLEGEGLKAVGPLSLTASSVTVF